MVDYYTTMVDYTMVDGFTMVDHGHSQPRRNHDD